MNIGEFPAQAHPRKICQKGQSALTQRSESA